LQEDAGAERRAVAAAVRPTGAGGDAVAVDGERPAEREVAALLHEDRAAHAGAAATAPIVDDHAAVAAAEAACPSAAAAAPSAATTEAARPADGALAPTAAEAARAAVALTGETNAGRAAAAAETARATVADAGGTGGATHATAAAGAGAGVGAGVGTAAAAAIDTGGPANAAGAAAGRSGGNTGPACRNIVGAGGARAEAAAAADLAAAVAPHPAAAAEGAAGSGSAGAADGRVAGEAHIAHRHAGLAGDKNGPAKPGTGAAPLCPVAALGRGAGDGEILDGDRHRHLGRAGEGADEQAAELVVARERIAVADDGDVGLHRRQVGRQRDVAGEDDPVAATRAGDGAAQRGIAVDVEIHRPGRAGQAGADQ
jgi:hypothetical protein